MRKKKQKIRKKQTNIQEMFKRLDNKKEKNGGRKNNK